MASVTYRASGFWADRMTYFEDTEQGMDDVEVDLGAEYDKRTPLDKTIDRIGMGASCSCISDTMALTTSRELSMDAAVIMRIR
jgi:hypothetical protein